MSFRKLLSLFLALSATQANADITANGQVKKAQLENLTSDPTCGATSEARIYWDSDDNLFRLCNGSGWTSVGSGDVVGPASSVDNSVPRFDGVTGKLLQGSAVTISDTGQISAPGGTNSEKFGSGVVASGQDGTVIGKNASALGNNVTIVGYNSKSAGTGASNVIVGDNNDFTTAGNLFASTTVIGSNMSVESATQANSSVLIGEGITATSTNIGTTVAIGAGVSVAGAVTTVGFSSEASGTASTAYGFDATASGANTVAVGADTDATLAGNIALGYGAQSLGSATTVLGYTATSNVSSQLTVAVGSGASTNANTSIAIGANADANFNGGLALAGDVTAANQMVVGGSVSPVNDITSVYIGNGVTNASPVGFSLNASGASGTNVAGGALTIAGGKGTGNAAGGAINFQTSDAGGSGTTLQTLATKMSVTGNNVVIGSGATASELRFLEPSGSGTNYGGIKAPALAADYTLTLPINDGTSASQWLLTDASGNLSFSDTTTVAKVIDTAADSIPLTITGHGTQTSDLLVVEADGGADSLVINGDDESTGANVVIRGTGTNDSAAAGFVGEYMEVYRVRTSSLGLTSNTAANLATTGGTSITLTAGDWDVSAVVGFNPAGTTTVTQLDAAISATSATMPASSVLAVPSAGEVWHTWAQASSAPGSDITLEIPPYRVTVASGATRQLYLVGRAIFATSTLNGYGIMRARRIR